jgi:hypothetical protein
MTWPNQSAAANPAITPHLHPFPLAGRTAELYLLGRYGHPRD